MTKDNVKRSVAVIAAVLAVVFLTANWRAATTSAGSRLEDDRFSAMLSNEPLPPGIELPAQSSEKPAEEVFKNIQELKGLPASQMYSVMNFMRLSLGFRCETCHVRDGNNWAWEKDDLAPKKTGREMIKLVVNLNKENFGGRPQVTCNSCHRGQTRPVAIPSETQVAEQRKRETQPTAQQAASNRPPDQMPTIDQILDKYTEGLGGKAAIDKLKTRVIKGTYTSHTTNMPMEVYQVAPNKTLTVVTAPNMTISQVFNGTAGWSINGKEKQEISGIALADLKQKADFFPYVNLKDQFQNLRVLRKDKVGDHETYVVSGATADRRRITLYFDTQSGLLLRRSSTIATMMGNLPVTEDYDDYRDVDGVKIPFKRHSTELGEFNAVTITLTEVKHNVTVEESKFNAGGF